MQNNAKNSEKSSKNSNYLRFIENTIKSAKYKAIARKTCNIAVKVTCVVGSITILYIIISALTLAMEYTSTKQVINAPTHITNEQQ